MNDQKASPRAYTAKEAREMFIEKCRALAKYWANTPEFDKATGHTFTIEDKMFGLVHSIFSVIDGGTELPALDISLSPHEDDRKYHQDNGENWFEPGMVINDCLLTKLLYFDENENRR